MFVLAYHDPDSEIVKLLIEYFKYSTFSLKWDWQSCRVSARPRGVRDMIEYYLLNPFVEEKARFLWNARTCAILWSLWREQNNRIFRGTERDSRDLWFLVHHYVSLWASTWKLFANYSLGFIFISWDPFLLWGFFQGWYRPTLFLYFFIVLNEAFLSLKKYSPFLKMFIL